MSKDNIFLISLQFLIHSWVVREGAGRKPKDGEKCLCMGDFADLPVRSGPCGYRPLCAINDRGTNKKCHFTVGLRFEFMRDFMIPPIQGLSRDFFAL